jgi:hypothetical protein
MPRNGDNNTETPNQSAREKPQRKKGMESVNKQKEVEKGLRDGRGRKGWKSQWTEGGAN